LSLTCGFWGNTFDSETGLAYDDARQEQGCPGNEPETVPQGHQECRMGASRIDAEDGLSAVPSMVPVQTDTLILHPPALPCMLRYCQFSAARRINSL